MKIFIKEYDTILETDNIIGVCPLYDGGRSSVLITMTNRVSDHRIDTVQENTIAIVLPSATRAAEVIEQIAETIGAKRI